LEAPDEAIGSATRAAVVRWTFQPFTVPGKGAVSAKSRLIFYFRIINNKPVVIDAAADGQ
jgi:hypothetical protein